MTRKKFTSKLSKKDIGIVLLENEDIEGMKVVILESKDMIKSYVELKDKRTTAKNTTAFVNFKNKALIAITAAFESSITGSTPPVFYRSNVQYNNLLVGQHTKNLLKQQIEKTDSENRYFRTQYQKNVKTDPQSESKVWNQYERISAQHAKSIEFLNDRVTEEYQAMASISLMNEDELKAKYSDN